MTRQEALEEARRRWVNGAVYDPTESSSGKFVVVERPWIDPARICGKGDSWEAAFADADRREKESKP